MQDLQFSLIVLGGFAILGVLVHGLWTIRNNKEEKTSKDREDTSEHSQSDSPMSPQELVEPAFSDVPDAIENSSDQQGYDELGIGQVRVVDVEPKKPEPMLGELGEPGFSAIAEQEEMPEPPISLMKGLDLPSSSPETSESEVSETDVAESSEPEKKAPSKPKVDMYPSPVTHNKADGAKVEPKITTTETQAPVQSHQRQEPRLNEEQMSIDFDDEIRLVADEKDAAVAGTAPAEPLQQEVLILNVRTSEDRPIPGSALLPMLLTLGFKFGDQDIFHRHVNSNGKGPVLFSLANMFKPGNFDIDNLENFTTQGISLFMMLPIDGDPHQVFNMMHNAARKIADEFGAQVLDGRRNLLTRQSLQQYVEKIREFERQRMLRK